MHGGVRISYMRFRFAWLANLGHASWHLKETVAPTGKDGVKCAQALPPR